jgi:hypothetical protein
LASLQAAKASIPPSESDLVKIVEGKESRPKKTSFEQDTKPCAKDTKKKATTTTSKRLTFLSKMPARNIVKLHKGPKRKYSSFFKVKHPRIQNAYGPEAEAELVNSMNNLLQIIWKFEPKTILLPCRRGNVNITKDSDPFKSRTQIQLYCDNAFIKPNFNTWMKIYLAHDKSTADYEEDQGLQGSIQEADLWFHLDKIQDRSAASIGWLLGSTPDSCNINNMKLAHENHPGLGIECEPRVQAIRLYPEKNNIPPEQQVKAVHIYVAKSNVAAARRQYNLVYGSNSSEYPMGQVMRYIPDASDPSYPVSMQTRAKVIRMMSKPKHLLASIATLHRQSQGYTCLMKRWVTLSVKF